MKSLKNIFGRFADRATQYIYRFADRASQYIYLSN